MQFSKPSIQLTIEMHDWSLRTLDRNWDQIPLDSKYYSNIIDDRTALNRDECERNEKICCYSQLSVWFKIKISEKVSIAHVSWFVRVDWFVSLFRLIDRWIVEIISAWDSLCAVFTLQCPMNKWHFADASQLLLKLNRQLGVVHVSIINYLLSQNLHQSSNGFSFAIYCAISKVSKRLNFLIKFAIYLILISFSWGIYKSKINIKSKSISCR